MEKIKVEHHTSASMGIVWFLGWLFTIGFLHLGFPKAVFAFLLWAYYLGVHFSRLGY